MHADLIRVITAAPDDNDVVAGPLGFIIFISLVLAVALLGWSLTKHLRKAHDNADAGLFDDPSDSSGSSASADSAESADSAQATSDNGSTKE